MIKIHKYHLLPILAIALLYLIGDSTNTILVWAVMFFAIEIFVAISLFRNDFLNKKNFYLNWLIFIIHLFYGLALIYASLAINVGSSSLIYR